LLFSWRNTGLILLIFGVVAFPRTAPAADDVVILASLDAKRIALGESVQLEVSLSNRTDGALESLQLAVTPNWASPVVLPQDSLPARVSRTYDLQLRPKSTGIFLVRVRVVSGTRSVGRVEAGALEVVEQPGWLTPYRDVVPIAASMLALGGTLLTLFFTTRMQGKTLSVTTRTQRKILQEARRQKAAEAVSQIVHQVARDYYGTVSGATAALADAVRRIPEAAGREKEHLLARAFFFYGTLLYGDNEFQFRQGLLFLPDLWAEADLRNVVNDVLSSLELTQEQESLMHKCFSDIAVVARQGDVSRVAIKARNLYEFEQLLADRDAGTYGEHRRIQELFDAVRSRFSDDEVRHVIGDAALAMKGILEYEFTVMYSDFYRQPSAAGRTRPSALTEFDEIVRIPTWRETTGALTRLDRRRVSQGRDRRSVLKGGVSC
jgi:hypothetical protein